MMAKRSTRSKSPRATPPAPGSQLLTTEQVLEQSDKSRETLYAWARKGYVAKPLVERVEHGRGRRALWRPGVVEQIRQMDQMVARGIPLHIVKQQMDLQAIYNSSFVYDSVREIADEWAKPGTAGDLPKRLGLGDAAASLKECFVFAVMRLGERAGLNEHTMSLLDWIAGEHLAPALMNFISGSEPTVVVTASGSFIAPKAALAVLGRSWVDRDEHWIDAIATTAKMELPVAHEQHSSLTPLDVFTCLDLGSVVGTLWQRSGRQWPLVFYVPAPVVWQHIEKNTYLEHDAEISSWGRRPLALVLDIVQGSARFVPGTARQDDEPLGDRKAAVQRGGRKVRASRLRG
jgi:hypothetical protein